MKLDRKALNRLADMNDAQLRAVIEKLIGEYNLDLSSFHLTQGDMNGLRQALRTATDEELSKLATQFKSGGKP